jgi:hypothetical protein
MLATRDSGPMPCVTSHAPTFNTLASPAIRSRQLTARCATLKASGALCCSLLMSVEPYPSRHRSTPRRTLPPLAVPQPRADDER